jgi:cysteine desulfurase/selenocysteine lyase
VSPSAASSAGLDIVSLRERFPALNVARKREIVYLDNACTVLKSRPVLEAMTAFYEHSGACGGKRSTHVLAQSTEEMAIAARRCAAEFLNAESPNEIVFTSGTTESANLVARAFPYEDGRREVIISDLEHNAVFLPFFEAAERGEIELTIVKSKNGRLDPADFERAVTTKTALVAVTHASNVAGGVQPIPEIVRISRAKGARIFVDDAQFVASHQEDVRSLQADFVAFSAHKIGGPFGLGVLFGKEQELNRLRHYKVGGGVVKSVAWDGGAAPKVRYLDAPMRFEAGVANFGALAGFVEAVKVLKSVPAAALRHHVGAMVARTVKGLRRMDHIRIVGEPEALETGSLVSFYSTHPEFSMTDCNLYFNHEFELGAIAVRAGEHCAHLLHQSLGLEATMRASFFAYNMDFEADLFLSAVESYCAEALK